jgi:outer membrane protein assembly factor BamB
MVYCIDFETGKIRWERVAHEAIPGTSRHIKNSYASETPVTDGQRVYAYFGNVGLFCYDLEGKELWKRKLGTYRMKLHWGTAASPVVYQDRVYVVHDNEEKSFLVCLDAKSGEQLWRVEREEKSNWATPFIWENSVRTELVTSATGKVRSYDLEGKLLWELSGMSGITIPTPFASHGMLFIGSGYVMSAHRPVYAIRPGATGDISLNKGEESNDYIAWYRKTASPYNPSPLVYGDYFYVLRDRGTFGCYDAKTGKELYVDQKLGASAFTSSPWAYDGKIFCLSEDGETFVIEAGPTFKLLRKNSLKEMCLATPAIAGGSLILRTESKLYRIQKNTKGAASGAAQLNRNKGDLHAFGQYYVLYTTEAAGSSPTTEGFKAYVLADRNARSLHQALQEERFEFVVRPKATSDMILGYEKKADRQGKRLVLRCGGAVELIDDQRFQAELKGPGGSVKTAAPGR